jgi:SpoVK/Ycf46/Vps4 family AAA+-type ATPase
MLCQTQLARAVAGELQAAYCLIRPSDLWSKFVGDSEAAVRHIFVQAAQQASALPSQCAVIFLDEIDALGPARGMSSGDAEGGCSRRVLAELLMVLSEITDHQSKSARFLILAATNRIDDLDPALLRRFAVQLPIYPPSKRDRKKLLQRHLQGISHEISGEALEMVSSWLEGWTGSGLVSLIREAAMTPVRECIHEAGRAHQRNAELGSTLAHEDLVQRLQSLRPVNIEDFAAALESMQPGSSHAFGSDLLHSTGDDESEDDSVA